MLLNLDFFHTELPPRPMGKYAHIVILRETKGYALFQTDGELNRARVSAGAANDTEFLTRIALFKRKQTTPERLIGRELLRNIGLMDASCEYNVSSCNKCADCITYGFAVGDGGSEKSKVYSDTAFSLTDYRDSHDVFTLNAPFENGTMSENGQVTSRINQQDHVKPQIYFPSVMTTRDLTSNLFFYVLNNIMRTERYGATTTRGGTVQNHIVAIVLNDGEIFSNLSFTQHLYDSLPIEYRDNSDPLPFSIVREAADSTIESLLAKSSTHQAQVLMGNELEAFLSSIQQMSDTELRAALQQATQDAELYHQKYIAKGGK
jgi:CRISPR-associated protein Csc2